MGERNPQDLVIAKDFLQQAAARLNLDPQVVAETMPHLLGMTKHIAHGVVRPAAPLAAFLVGLAAASAAQAPESGPQAVKTDVLAGISEVEDLMREYQSGQA